MLNIILRRNYRSICPQSIRWILNLKDRNYHNDKHTDDRLTWIIEQSRFIDSRGWEAWLRSERAYGYDWHKAPNADRLKNSINRISTNNSN